MATRSQRFETLTVKRSPKPDHGQKCGHDTAAAPPRRQIAVSDLLAGSREVILTYKESEYRLRLTSNDKVILTK